MKQKRPVSISDFNPLSMVIATIIASIVLSEQFELGEVYHHQFIINLKLFFVYLWHILYKIQTTYTNLYQMHKELPTLQNTNNTLKLGSYITNKVNVCAGCLVICDFFLAILGDMGQEQ